MLWDFSENNFKLWLFKILMLFRSEVHCMYPYNTIVQQQNFKLPKLYNNNAKIPMLSVRLLHCHKVAQEEQNKKTWSENFAIIALQIPIKSP